MQIWFPVAVVPIMVEGGLAALGLWRVDGDGGYGSRREKGDEQQRQERMKGDGGARDQERIGFLVRE